MTFRPGGATPNVAARISYRNDLKVEGQTALVH